MSSVNKDLISSFPVCIPFISFFLGGGVNLTLARVCYVVLKRSGGSLILFLFLILEGNKASVFSPGSRMLAVGLL